MLKSCLWGKGQPLWLSDLHHDAHGLKNLVTLDFLSRVQECIYWFEAMQVRHPPLESTILAANCTHVREQQSTRSTPRPGASNGQGPAMAEDEQRPTNGQPWHWQRTDL